MKCLGCKKRITGGILWSVDGQETFHMDKELVLPVIRRVFGFCSSKCETEFFLSKDRMSKADRFRQRASKNIDDVRKELQAAFLSTDNENTRDLIDCLRRNL
jgi:hypothetical protein